MFFFDLFLDLSLIGKISFIIACMTSLFYLKLVYNERVYRLMNMPKNTFIKIIYIIASLFGITWVSILMWFMSYILSRKIIDISLENPKEILLFGLIGGLPFLLSKF